MDPIEEFLNKNWAVLQNIVGHKWGIHPSREEVHQRLFEMFQPGFEPAPLKKQGNAFDWLCTYAYFEITNQFKRKPKPAREEKPVEGERAESANVKEYNTQPFEQAMEQAKGEFKKKFWQMFYQAKILERPVKEVAKEMGVSPLTVYGAVRRINKRLREIFRSLDDGSTL